MMRANTIAARRSIGRSQFTLIFASSFGALLEWYDFYVYAALAAVFSVLFFPSGNDTAAFLASLATFGAGFLVRPIGALFFGRLGDRIGRKYTFMATIVLMGVATVGVGLLPPYAEIGMLAPVILVLLRLLARLLLPKPMPMTWPTLTPTSEPAHVRCTRHPRRRQADSHGPARTPRARSSRADAQVASARR